MRVAESWRRTLTACCSTCRLFPEPWWAAELGRRPSSWWLQHIDTQRLQELPAGQRVGLLNSVADLVKHLGHKLVPFLPELASVVLLLLQGACQPLHLPQVRGFLCRFSQAT